MWGDVARAVLEGLGQAALNQYAATEFAKKNANGETVLFSATASHSYDGDWFVASGSLLITHRRFMFDGAMLEFAGRRIEFDLRTLVQKSMELPWTDWGSPTFWYTGGNDTRTQRVIPDRGKDFVIVMERILKVPASRR
jgi:hypothetical protein